MAVTLCWPLVSSQEWLALTESLELSPRQADIIRHLLRGESDKQIAHELKISVATVRTHLRRLFQKFDINDRVELILYIFGCLRQDASRSAAS